MGMYRQAGPLTVNPRRASTQSQQGNLGSSPRLGRASCWGWGRLAQWMASGGKRCRPGGAGQVASWGCYLTLPRSL